ncbi:MAG: hypothetical protein MI861_22805, partial [Pirellulales bacterium]|nr:hypothetical protein [Pirellulales bacterium]
QGQEKSSGEEVTLASLINREAAHRDAPAPPQRLTLSPLRDPAGAVALEQPVVAEEIEVSSPQVTCQCGHQGCYGVCRDPGHPAKPKRDQPGDVDRGDCPPLRYRISDCRRAGNPHCVAKWAKCSVTGKYSAWYVGGGAPFFRGRGRQPHEGTWGLDYGGLFGRANVWLNYTRGRQQGGEGAYQTDGEPEFVSRAHNLLGLGH